ncbi:follicle-stimulating hormone receptor-like [Oculina patagonica]
MSLQVLFGILGGCLNVVVVLNIMLTKTLRNNISMVLVGNLALGDTLICVFSALMASVVVSSHREALEDISASLCPKVGSLWVLGQCTNSITSVALTLERYLCIVFSMTPGIRMTPRLASLAIAFNWVVAVFMMSTAHYFKIYRRNFLCIPMVYDSNFPIETRYSIALGATGITLYLVTIPLYIHIYRVVKRSSQQMGVQRESTLAKRIAILVGTNLVFFFVPILLLGAWKLFVNFRHQMLLSIYLRRTISEYIPQYCLIINSCLNPLVHAFRNDKFKKALKRNLPCRKNTSNVAPSNK